MKVMLTSFGVNPSAATLHSLIWQNRGMGIFTHMPPVNMHAILNGFVPEYSLLVLSEKLIFDEQSFELLTGPGPVYPFWNTARTIDLLHREGFLELRDYTSVLGENAGLLKRMTDNDLRSTDQWIESLGYSLQAWQSFIGAAERQLDEYRIAKTYNYEIMHIFLFLQSLHSLDGSYRREAESDWLGPSVREALEGYLGYVNANLVLSNEFEAALHDWEDFLPFYKQKFLSIGEEDPGTAAQATASRQLFEIAFPEFAIRGPEQLLRILEHKRVGELRALVEEAARGTADFDDNFARSVFREVIGLERDLARKRKLVGYITVPIGFIPMVGNFAQLLIQEAAGTMIERKLKKEYRWFYMLSDIARDYRPTKELDVGL